MDYNAGMDDHVAKPIDMMKVLETLGQWDVFFHHFTGRMQVTLQFNRVNIQILWRKKTFNL